MKNILKKISAVALAFTLLGTGTVITRNVSPKASNTLTANAISCDNCHGGSYHISTRYEYVWGGRRIYVFEETYCSLCGKVLSSHLV